MEYQKEFLNRLKLIFNFLKKEKIEFLVCGGIAFGILVYPRSTVDLDLILNLKEKDVENFKILLKKAIKKIIINEAVMKFGPISILRAVIIERQKEFIFDFLFLDENYVKEILKRKIEIEFFKIRFPIISPEDLYLLKSLTGRKQDKIDMEEIKKKYKINFNYVSKWLKKLKG